MTRDELIAKLQQRRNNDVIVYVVEGEGSITLQIEDVDYDEATDAIVIDTEPLAPVQVSFAEAHDRRGFRVLVDDERVGEVTYDDFGWGGIDCARKLVAAVAKACGAEVAG